MTTAVATPTKMRTPEYGAGARGAPDGQHFENEYFQFLKPESFTVLPPDETNNEAPGPSPPRAPEPYKLTPRKRHKNQAFAIIAEPGLSAPSSRAGSPTGRVSPFRGRGFNPTGSRHASPAPSPPPGEGLDDDAILRHSRELQQQLRKSSIGRSQIPILKTSRSRRSSVEDILSPETSPPGGLSPTRSNLQQVRYSRSMINIAPTHLAKKPPPSPRKTTTLKPSFVRLSPIIGSSPEAGSDQMSSPSRIPTIPKSRSQPGSRIMSPSRILSPSESRNPSRNPSRPPSRGQSRPASRNGSRSTSREPSPGRSPSKISMKNSVYKNIPAKIDTFSRIAASKPKVPQKPKVYSTRTSNLDRSRPSSIRKNVHKSQIAASKSPRRDVEDTETTDTERDVRSSRRPSISSYSNNASRRNSISKPSTSGYSKQQTRTRYDSEKPTTSKGNNRNTSDSNERSSATSTVAEGSSKTIDKENKSKTSSQTYRRDDTGAKESRRRHDTTTATSTTEDLSNDETTEDAKDDDILSVTIDEIMGSQTTKIVSATAETVVKPLNIEARLIKQSEVNQSETTYSSSNQRGGNSTNSASNQKGGTNNSSNSSANQKSGTNNSSNSASNQKSGTTNSSNSSSNQKSGTNNSSNSTSNQKAGTNSTNQKTATNNSSNASSNQRTGNNGGTNSSTNQKASSNNNSNSNSKPSDSTTNNGNNKTTSNQNINNSTSDNNSNNLTTPANGSIANTPSSNVSNNMPNSGQNSTISSTVNSANNQMESVNNNLKHVSNSLTPSVNSLEMNVKNNLNNLTPPDSDKVSSKSLMDSSPLTLTSSAKMKQARTVIVDEIKPIKITVREKGSDIEVQSGNYAMPRSATNGIAERPLLPPNNHPQNPTDPAAENPSKPGPCSKIFSCCKKKPDAATAAGSTVSGVQSLGSVAPDVAAGDGEAKPQKCWDKICCKSKGGKVGDVNKFSCFPKIKKEKENDNWAERRDSILSAPPKKQPFSMTLKKIFCAPCAKCKKKPDESLSRRPSMMSKKKSLSSTMQPPPEDTGPKLDQSLVEYASHMRGAIPVLPVPLAWVCLICNVFIPGFGTILSGLFCLCIGKPRFSPRDSAKARVGAFFIDVIVGISQAFTVLFCLVGWGWSIWWGVIMLKVARKHRKIKKLEDNAIEEAAAVVPSVNVNHTRDVERGS